MHVGAPTHHHAHPPPGPMGPASSSRFRDAFAAAKKQYGPVPGGSGSPHQQRPFLRSASFVALTKLPILIKVSIEVIGSTGWMCEMPVDGTNGHEKNNIN